MNWQSLGVFRVIEKWRFTSVTDGAYFRLSHLQTTPIKLLIAQAQAIGTKHEIWDIREAFASPELEIFLFEKPPFFTDRKLAFKSASKLPRNFLWNLRFEVNSMPLTNPITVQQPVATSVTATSVTAATTSGTILAANATRKGGTIWNASTATLFIELGATASLTAYSAQIAPGGYYEIPFNYTGVLSGIWSAVNGSALVREFV